MVISPDKIFMISLDKIFTMIPLDKIFMVISPDKIFMISLDKIFMMITLDKIFITISPEKIFMMIYPDKSSWQSLQKKLFMTIFR